jgi:hypothetical protein
MDPRVNTDFDDEESFEPPTLEHFYELIQILKEKKIPYSIVKSFK